MSREQVIRPVKGKAWDALGRKTLWGRNPALRAVLAASLVSTLGDRLHQVALAALVLAETGSLASAGLIFFVSTLPYVLFGLATGPLVDRLRPRTVLVGADLTRVLLVLGILAIAPLSLPLVYMLVFGVACMTMAFAPAQQAVVPLLVEGDELTSANALLKTTTSLTEMLGFPLAGVLVASLVAASGSRTGIRTAFAVDALSYAISGAILWRVPALRRNRDGVRQVGTLGEQIRMGLHFLLGDSQIRTNTLLLTIGPLLLGCLNTLWVGFAWDVSHTNATGYGLLQMLAAGGALVGLACVGPLGRRIKKGRLILLGFVVMGSATFVIGFITNLVWAGLLAGMGGIGNMLFLVPSITLVQERTPAHLRGRIFSLRLMLSYAAFATSNAVAGIVADRTGISPLFLVLGGLMLAVGLAACVFKSDRDVR